MKIQDVLFLIVLVFLLYKKNPFYNSMAGIVCLVASGILFTFWIFFTAERLLWYAAAFFLLSIGILIIRLRKKGYK